MDTDLAIVILVALLAALFYPRAEDHLDRLSVAWSFWWHNHYSLKAAWHLSERRR